MITIRKRTSGNCLQRVQCQYCKKCQVLRVNARGRIYVLLPGGRFSKGTLGRTTKGEKFKEGKDLLRTNAEQREEQRAGQKTWFPPNHPRRHDDDEEK